MDNDLLIAIITIMCAGVEFKPFYAQLEGGGGVRALTTALFIALSASAPPSVESAVVASLHLQNPARMLQSLDRPNIFSLLLN